MNTSKLTARLLAPLAGLMLASTAQASLMITSVEMLIAGTDFKVAGGTQFADAMNVFDTAYQNSPVCSVSLDSLDSVGRKFNCDGAHSDTGTLFTISGHNTGTSVLQFGLDWGRGGFSEIAFSGETELNKYTHDIWWGRNWNNPDVLTFELTTTGDFTMTLLGFEKCCNGVNSARYRSGDLTGGGQGETPWQTLSVNAAAVPAPPVMWLFGLGLAGMAVSRRAQKA